MIRVAVPALLACGIASAALAQAGDVVVRTKLDPADGAVVGQPVRIRVDVLFPGEMPRPPRVALGDAAGAQILRFETQAVTMREQIGGQSYVGQEFEFVLFPRRGGTIVVPAADIVLLDRAGDLIGSARGEPQRLSVTVPPGIDESGPVLAAAEISATETWSPDPGTTPLKAGDAVIRTIRRQASGVPALGMADLAFPAPAGVRVYVDPPLSDDHVVRGEVTGSRTDRVTYVFEKPGTYALADLAQPWWDLDDSTAKVATLSGTTIRVALATPPPAATEPMARRWTSGIAGALALALAVAVLIALGRLLTPRWRERARALQASERAARRTLTRAARTGDAAATYRALTVWLECVPSAGRETVRTALAPLVEPLERSLFGTGIWSEDLGRELAKAADAAAAELALPREASAAPPLPPLNPSAAGRVR